MSLSRAELQSMDRDELIETIVDLSRRVEDLETQSTLEALEVSAVRRLLAGLSGFKADDVDITEVSSIEMVDEIVDRFEELHDTVEDLEARNQRLEQRLQDGGAGGKDQKVADIVEYAQNRRSGEDVVQLTAKEIKGATGCSRRYAYDLMDDENLPSEYDWILAKKDIKQYGDLEIKKEDGTRRIGIDFEGVHSAGCPLNKFTTGAAGEEGP